MAEPVTTIKVADPATPAKPSNRRPIDFNWKSLAVMGAAGAVVGLAFAFFTGHLGLSVAAILFALVMIAAPMLEEIVDAKLLPS